MMHRSISISESFHKSICTITISNARFVSNAYNCIVTLLTNYLLDEKIFFSFYREDCINITRKQKEICLIKIHDFFESNGALIKQNNYLTVATAVANTNFLDIVLDLFDCHLETLMFIPKVNFKVFEEYNREYLKHTFKDYISSGITDLLFCYTDSSDLSICFDRNTIEYNKINTLIYKLFAI